MTWPTPERVPPPPSGAVFLFEPLAPHHNERDHAAWMSSIDHIRATPGFAPGDRGDDRWPVPMSLGDNLVDLTMHEREFVEGVAYAWSVLDPATAEVIGCVYVDPDPTGAAEATVTCWVTASRAALDDDLAVAMRDWLRDEWPLRSVRFPGRFTS